MAERKSGPVKPPVIDLTARPTAKSEAKPAAKAVPSDSTAAAAKPAATVVESAKEAPASGSSADESTPKSAATVDATAAATDRRSAAASAKAGIPPSGGAGLASKSRETPPPRVNAVGTAIASGIGGAVIAIAICYGLAASGYWPASNDTRLAAAEKSGADATAGLADLKAQFGTLETNVAAKLAAAGASLTTLQAGIDKLQASGGDLGAVRDQLKTLSARLDAVAAGASSADAGALAANLSTVEQQLAALTQKVSALDDRAGGSDSAIAALKSELGTAKAAIDKAAAAPSPKAIAAAMQLPLLISALDADFAAGRPFAADLAALEAAVPEAHVPASLSGAAANGLPAAADVVAAFETRMPDLMAARPASTDSSWQGQAGDWLKGVLALRQEAPEAGDGPDAVLSRLEAAVNRHDFGGAITLLGQLPQPIQQAAGEVRAKLQSLADADAFLADLRQKALAPAAGVEQ